MVLLHSFGLKPIFSCSFLSSSMTCNFLQFCAANYVSGSGMAKDGRISGRDVSPNAGDDMCFELARRWRDVCQQQHGAACPQVLPHKMPTRLLDVGPNDGSQEPRLRTTGNEHGKWVALSHCWGTQSSFKLESTNILAWQTQIRLEDLPQTFRDAVIVTRRLGYRYLWIDSLCIVQNDHSDWLKESVCMRDYYQHAVITISADSASGDQVGFLGPRQSFSDRLALTLASGHEIGVRRHIGCPSFQNRDTCVSRRAWTLQEFMLSPRSLLYTPEQLVWECQTHKYCESDENLQGETETDVYSTTKRFFSTPELGKAQFPEYEMFFNPIYKWYNLVSDYVTRDLTNRNDIFPSISGLAREIERQTSNTYAAGIWLEDFHRGLLWQMNGAGIPSKTYLAPSWSWASLELTPGGLDPPYGKLNLNICFTYPEDEDRRATLLTHEIVPTDDDPFGCISLGLLRMRGKALDAEKWQGETKPHFNHVGVTERSHFHSPSSPYAAEDADQLICYFDIVEKDANLEENLGDVTMFQISTWLWQRGTALTTMVLLLVPAAGQPEGTYRRVGIAEVPNYEDVAESGWEIVELCII